MNRPHHNREIPEKDDPLWTLLGKAEAPPEATPFFSRNVLRALRTENVIQSTRRGWMSLFRPVPVAAAAVLVLASVFMARDLFESPQTPASTSISAVESEFQDFELFADLEGLIAYEENALWVDSF